MPEEGYKSKTKQFEQAVYTIMCRPEMDEIAIKPSMDLVVRTAQEGDLTDKSRVAFFVQRNLHSTNETVRARAKSILTSLLRTEDKSLREILRSENLITN